MKARIYQTQEDRKLEYIKLKRTVNVECVERWMKA